MSDHDFEKQVKIRLEQLKLRPSDAVWTEVEKNIRRDKHRRRMILWLPIALLMLGAGGYFAMNQTARPAPQELVKQAIPSSSATPNNKLSTKASTQTQATTDSTINEQTLANKSTTGETSAATAPAPAHTSQAEANHQPTAQVTTSPSPKSKRFITENSAPAPKLAKQPIKRPKKNNQRPSAALLVVKDKPATPVQEPVVDKDLNTETIVSNDTKQLVEDSAAVATSFAAADSSLTMAMPVDSVAKDSTQTVAATPNIPAPETIVKADQPKKKTGSSKWKFGVQAEGGYSGVTGDGLFGFLQSGNSSVADLASPQFNNAATMAPQFPRPVNKASSLTMGPAYSFGGFARRTLSKRLSLSVGLQYTYLSARQVVGSKVNNNRTVNRAPSTSQLVTEYYDANNTQDYTNRYHFIELPVTLHTQLNKGKRLPITWDAGFSVSKLLNTNALHYDGLGGVYYKDNALFNKVQWVASTGFNVQLFSQSTHPISVGPVMRYNISPLLKKDYSTGQHLWSVGLRATVLLKK